MKFSTPKLAEQFQRVHLKLRGLMQWVDAWLDDAYEEELIVTDLERTLAQARRIYAACIDKMPMGGGPHCTRPCRAADASLKQLTIDQQNHLAHDINVEWEYDPHRPKMVCALIHDVGHGRHLHLQVHDRTRRRQVRKPETTGG